MRVRHANKSVISILSGLFIIVPLWASAMTTAIYVDEASLQGNELVALFQELLAAEGCTVAGLDGTALCNAATLTPDNYQTLILPDAARLPMASIPSVQQYLQAGGNLITLNAPAWRERLVHVGNAWKTPEQFRKETVHEAPPQIVLDFNVELLEHWHRSAFRMDTPTRYTIIPDAAAPGVAALEVDIPNMENWDSACREFEATPFPEGHSVTVFLAKGGDSTGQLAVEWRERDGSRWFAVVPLTREWQRYMLISEDFKYWESVPDRAATAFNPGNASGLSFTLAYTHTGHLQGTHKFWVAQMGTAPMSEEYRALLGELKPPALDTIAPEYKLYETTDVASIAAALDQTVAPEAAYPLVAPVRAIHPRPEASGFDKQRPWRWMPLLEARAADGSLRGYPAAITVHADGPYKNGVWASFGIGDPNWYLSEAGRALLRSVIVRMKTPVYFLDAGAHFYTYFEGQTVILGAQLIKTDVAEDVPMQLLLRACLKDGTCVFDDKLDIVSPEAGVCTRLETRWTPEIWPEEGYSITAELFYADRRLDVASHEIFCWRPKTEPNFVTVEKGEFRLDGSRWRPHGVNYMPSSGIAVEWQEYFEYWMGAAAYHPKIIQRDLERCKAMGCNALSIFLHRPSMEAQNLLDLLRRMEALGLKANLSLRPGTPMNFPWEHIKEMIEYYHLASNDTVFAYDLAWEPQFRPSERDPFNAQWEAWIIERYGSLENAEKDWGCPVPRNAEGKVVNISPHMIGPKGNWDVMVAAYRRFLDTLLYEKYSEARRLVKSIDPNHPVSFRMSMAGDPTDIQTEALLYDFSYLAGAVDILEPEAYGRIGDWERIKPGWFTREYARWANPKLPMIWAEAGVHVWDMAHMKSSEERLNFQAAYYTDFYKMMLTSGADGIFWWWYPGGFRVNEKSDYGVINPDGTDRPVTRIIREHAPLMAAASSPAPINVWLAFDRDVHTNGLSGIYEELAPAFWQAIESGNTPGLTTAASGADSTACPALAVGNTPLNGSNPPKYLDAFFDSVEIKAADGSWIRIMSGGSVAVPPEQPVTARLTYTNLGEAILATQQEAGDAAGSIFITVSGDVKRQEIPLPVRLERFQQGSLEVALADKPGEKPIKIIIGFLARERSPLGQRFSFTLTPSQ